MADFYTADQHYDHSAVIDFCNRPFSSVEEMDNEMIRMHNERVENSDDVYFLGDFSASRNEKYIRHIFNKLKGRKHLIIGNHDSKQVLRLNWSSTPTHKKTVRDKEGRRIILSHYPERSWDRMYRGSFHLHGHTHGKLLGVGRSTDVGVDAWGFAPVTAAEAIERMREWNHDFDSYAPESEFVIQAPKPSF